MSGQTAVVILWILFAHAEVVCQAFYGIQSAHSSRRKSGIASSRHVAANSAHHQVSIEYCTGCRWNLRAFWMAQELLTTFQNDLGAVTLIPSSEADGRFCVRSYSGSGRSESVVLWDRQEMGEFPEMKVLKQLVRDEIDPKRFLGHSDVSDHRRDQELEESTIVAAENDAVASNCEPSVNDPVFRMPLLSGAVLPHVAIAYCTGCRWLLRAAYFAQELVQTFDGELKSISLVPCKQPAGTFVVQLGEDVLWDRTVQKGFPETKELKQRVRDKLSPMKDLGHSDNKERTVGVSAADDMDDDDAEEARKFFGVM